ncbi:MAG: dTDP-glucose 4,6-dehydratase [Myxococcales bacterium]
MNVRNPENLLVTGGCGFIGSAFVRMLFRDPAFHGRVVNLDLLTYAGNPQNLEAQVDESRYTFCKGDIADARLVGKLLDEHRVDTVVHFAAETHVDRSIHGPREFIDTNVLGTFHLLEAVRARPHVHFHHVSTDEVYGSLGDTGAFTEETPYSPRSPYSASKAASDHLVAAYAHTYGLSTTLSNCSNNYGPYQFPEKLIPLMILNAMEGKPLPVYGDGRNVRDWLYVDDHVEAVWLVLTRSAPGARYNIGGRNEWRNLDLLDALLETLAAEKKRDLEDYRKLITFVKDRPGHDRRYAMDSSRIERDLGWAPRHDFAAGLRETVRWYLNNLDWVESVRTGAYRSWLERNYVGR